MSLAVREGFSPTSDKRLRSSRMTAPTDRRHLRGPAGRRDFTSRGVTFRLLCRRHRQRHRAHGDQRLARILSLRRRDRLVLQHRHPDCESQPVQTTVNHVLEERRHDRRRERTFRSVAPDTARQWCRGHARADVLDDCDVHHRPAALVDAPCGGMRRATARTPSARSMVRQRPGTSRKARRASS